MFRVIIVTIFALLFLNACASEPKPEELAAADYGTYPDNYVQIVKDYLGRALKDPSSAQYGDFTTPRKYWMGGGLTPRQFGYMTCATYNAKNSFGGYVGYETDLFLIKNGMVIQFIEKADNFLGKNMCIA